MRRSRREPDATPVAADTGGIERWLLGEAMRETDPLRLVEDFAVALSGSHLGLDRLSVHVGTLHPQAIGIAWHWSRLDGFCDEIRVSPQALDHPSFRQTPLFRVIEHAESFRGDTRDAELAHRFPFLRELGEQGLTEYVAFPIGEAPDKRRDAVTLSTCAPDGFRGDALAEIRRLCGLFALHAQRHVARLIASNVVRTYLGDEAGTRVLDGTIRRGAGESGPAVIWMSDLRGFTDLSERLAPADMLALLDAYFDVMAGAVLDEGGSVLKFIGDGLLAGFGEAVFGGRDAAAEAALRAARKARAGLDALNAEPPTALAAVDGWQPLRTGIGLHAGEVFFGNVGAPDRLDFTVIGRAVNVASRVESLCRPLGRSILLTAEVARHLATPLEALGRHTLKGVAEPVEIFGLSDEKTS